MARGTNEGREPGLPRAYVRPCLLLLLAEGPSHGYELLEQVRELGVRNADAGGLYRTLRSLEREGLVASWWEPSQAGPARRTYTLSDGGRDSLRGWAESLRDVHGMLGAFLTRYTQKSEQVRSSATP